MNEFIKFYDKYNISPVRQDLSNFDKHKFRRKSLFRELGITDKLISNSDILEIGPGGGYNSIVNAMCAPLSYYLVEPNTTGYKEMIALFTKYAITDNIYFENRIFDKPYNGKLFDIVLAEGFIPGLDDKLTIINAIKSSTKNDGVVVVTTSDPVSYFLEVARRYLANKLIKDEVNFNKKTKLLSEAFQSHLKSLAGASRPIEDWVQDNLINPATANINYSIFDAIQDFEDDFYYYGSSPNLFHNLHWYKEIEIDTIQYNKDFKKQFSETQHCLFLKELGFSSRDSSLNYQLNDLCIEFYHYNKKLEEKNYENIDELDQNCIACIENIKENMKTFSNVGDILDELIFLIKNTKIDSIGSSKIFGSAFGKGQQYISFLKS